MFANVLTSYVQSLDVVPDEVSVQTGMLDASLIRAVLIAPPLTGYTSVPTMPGYHTGTTKIIVRDNDPLRGYDLAFAIYEALTVSALALTGYKIVSMVPYQLPITYPKNDAALYEHSIEFDTRFVRL